MTQALIFSVGRQQFGILVEKTEHAVRMVEVTRLPAAPSSVAGIINYHGEFIPVFDIRSRFSLSPRGNSLSDLLIIAVGKRRVAIMADQVIGVREVGSDLVSPETILPGLGGVKGVVMYDDGLLLIIDPDLFLTPEEEESLIIMMPGPL